MAHSTVSLVSPFPSNSFNSVILSRNKHSVDSIKRDTSVENSGSKENSKKQSAV